MGRGSSPAYGLGYSDSACGAQGQTMTRRHAYKHRLRRFERAVSEACGCGHSWSMHNEFGCYKRDGGIAGHDTYCMCQRQAPQIVAAEAEKSRQRELLYGCTD